jgi:bacterioferritin (cytochrome b1)
MELNKKERKKLIARISEVSGVAQYALEAKMPDEQVIEVANNLKIISFIKAANNYNRYCQGQKTAEANTKLKKFMELSNSEFYKAGKWLVDALSTVGQDRKQNLLEKDLVHKADYNQTVTDLKATIKEQQQAIRQQTSEAKKKIHDLENRVDSLQKHLKLIQNYITDNYSSSNWHDIANHVQKKSGGR